MSGGSGQAAGLAVSAAVGTSIGGAINSFQTNKQQAKLEKQALALNQAQFHAKAAAQSASHASNFRQSLAHQVSIANMRGGTGSIAAQFGNQAYRTFEEDQKAIELGVDVADTQAALSNSDINNRRSAADTNAIGRVISAFDAVNINMPRSK